MKNILKLTSFLLLTGLILSPDIMACRYTIREIGFSDLGSVPYKAYFFINSTTTREDQETLKKLSFALLYETNLRFEIIHTEEDKDSEAIQYVSKYKIRVFPSLVVVSPEGESHVYPLKREIGLLTESVWLLLEQLVWSPVRRSIVDQLLQSYCVVLIVEGTDAAANAHAMKEVTEAVNDIAQTLDQMPKVVHAPPSVVVIRTTDRLNEKVLAQSLGLSETVSKNPAVAVIYGRGRVLGPVLRGGLITKRTVFNLLTVVGADCECGLDHSWILGRMIPLRWESFVQAELVKFLGFDVESPLVKTEMSQIISLKPENAELLNPMEENLLGYVEKRVEVEEKPGNISRISAYEVQKSFGKKTSVKNNMPLISIFIVIGGLFLIVSIGGVVIYLLNKRKNNGVKTNF